jgi:hypothetical protein
MFPIYQSLYRHHGLLEVEQLMKMSSGVDSTSATSSASSDGSLAAMVKSERGSSLSPPGTTGNPLSSSSSAERKPFLKFSVNAILAKDDVAASENQEEFVLRRRRRSAKKEVKEENEEQVVRGGGKQV